MAECSLGKHPQDSDGHVTCVCGAYAEQQCCDQRGLSADYGPCKAHKCGPRIGCRCPLPEVATNA